VENPKQAVFVRASTASTDTKSILADLVFLPFFSEFPYK
jgi:hypothetical protein